MLSKRIWSVPGNMGSEHPSRTLFSLPAESGRNYSPLCLSGTFCTSGREQTGPPPASLMLLGDAGTLIQLLLASSPHGRLQSGPGAEAAALLTRSLAPLLTASLEELRGKQELNKRVSEGALK